MPEATDNTKFLAILVAMMGVEPFRASRRLSRERKVLLLRAVATLTAMSAGVAFLPFRRAIRLGSVAVGARTTASIDDIIWATEAAARRLPWRTVCIEKGLAAQRMLRKAGVDATLRYGARHHPQTGKLEAHVWVTADGRSVMGAEEASTFAPVATYPPSGA